MNDLLYFCPTGESLVSEQEDEVEESEGWTVVFTKRPGK